MNRLNRPFDAPITDDQGCDCPICTSKIWDRSTGYRALFDPPTPLKKPVPQPNRLTWAGVFWIAYGLALLAASSFALRALSN